MRRSLGSEGEDRSAQRRAGAAALVHSSGQQSAAAAYLHLARTVCRRAERLMVEPNDQPGEKRHRGLAKKYVNRLSDFLFVARRHANDKGATDVLWVPGQNL